MIYQKYIKRGLDILCSVIFLLLFWWLYIILYFLVKKKLGSPVIFKQLRPGKDEKIFTMYKFRSMTDERDSEGNLLPDHIRLTSFGKKLRASSLDELPEIINILKGDMSFVGPRPQLVRDMVFMNNNQRLRHTVRPGLTGLAQVSGRNAINWEKKLRIDLNYIKNISLWLDIKIIFQTVKSALIKREGITSEDMATAEDYGDYLLNKHKISLREYENNILNSITIIDESSKNEEKKNVK